MLAMTRRMSQLMGLLILVSMIFVLLSVGSYSLDDPAWNHYMSREVINVENLGGRAGAFLADWGLQFFRQHGVCFYCLHGTGGDLPDARPRKARHRDGVAWPAVAYGCQHAGASVLARRSVLRSRIVGGWGQRSMAG